MMMITIFDTVESRFCGVRGVNESSRSNATSPPDVIRLMNSSMAKGRNKACNAS